ncbi:MAG TPA: DUF3106 domain-containing protein, partial [Burkholderiales bacterium]
AVATVVLAIFLLVGTAIAVPAAHAESPGIAWSQLTAEQKSILAPLEQEWDKLDPDRRKRWVNLANRYPSLPAERQQRIQQRMQEWVSLTPEQRVQALERYKRLKQLPPGKPDQLHERWREYQGLSEEQRQNLREGHATPLPAGK